MARRTGRKPKSKPVTLASGFAMIEIDNPLHSRDHADSATNPRKALAMFDMRESYPGFLYAKRWIDDAQKRAADRVRFAYELMGGAGAKAIDYARENVDGGQIAQTVTSQHLQAAKWLREAHDVLGPDGYGLIVRYCGEGYWPKDFTVNTKTDKTSYAFRDCLTALAEVWGWKIMDMRSYRVA